MNPSLDDLDRIMAVMEAAFDPAFGEAWNRRQVEDALLLGNSHYGLVSASGDTPETGKPAAGFYLARRGHEEQELLLLAVDPAWRRRGLGQHLIQQLCKVARSEGCQRIFLEMRRGNPAERLYINNGFQTIGLRPGYYRAGDGSRIDAITFVLEPV